MSIEERTPQENADKVARVESNSESGRLPEVRQLIEKINAMSAPEVKEFLETLSYEEISVLTTLGAMAEARAKELEDKMRTENLSQ